MASYQHPLIRDRRAHAFADERNKDCQMNYEDGHCPVAEKVIPRMILGYPIAPEEMVKQDAEKLYNVIRKF